MASKLLAIYCIISPYELIQLRSGFANRSQQKLVYARNCRQHSLTAVNLPSPCSLELIFPGFCTLYAVPVQIPLLGHEAAALKMTKLPSSLPHLATTVPRHALTSGWKTGCSVEISSVNEPSWPRGIHGFTAMTMLLRA